MDGYSLLNLRRLSASSAGLSSTHSLTSDDASDITLVNDHLKSPSFPFQGLPLELRLIIYEYAFSVPCQHHEENVVVTLHQATRRPHFRCNIDDDDDDPHRTLSFDITFKHSPRLTNWPTGLIQANRQIHAEALPYLYHNVIFALADNRSVLLTFLDRLSLRAKKSLRRIRVAPCEMLAEQLYDARFFWGITCAALTSLKPSLEELQVAFVSPEQLTSLSSDFHVERYADKLAIVETHIRPVFLNIGGDGTEPTHVAEARGQFEEILQIAKAKLESTKAARAVRIRKQIEIDKETKAKEEDILRKQEEESKRIEAEVNRKKKKGLRIEASRLKKEENRRKKKCSKLCWFGGQEDAGECSKTTTGEEFQQYELSIPSLMSRPVIPFEGNIRWCSCMTEPPDGTG
jgi:hypothetical protein